jgi:3'-phosphoadenosine 5'-phosphosulfate sulfotransferase (PAPS reductase)/FAD synthetase
MNNYILPPNSVISFSGGRTSGYMLRHILDAYNGSLPDSIKVIFNNTGKERSETLAFIHEVEVRWNVAIVWLEYDITEDDKATFKIVDYWTASRNGEPFAKMIVKDKMLPNPVARKCTAQLKIRTTHRYLKSIGWTEYHNALGIRADEPKRIKRTQQPMIEIDLFGQKKRLRTWKGETGERVCYPLASGGVTLEQVKEFWKQQSFDLQLEQDQGNCDLCFLKGAKKLIKIIAEKPDLAEWWIEMERTIKAKNSEAHCTFRSDRPAYSDLKKIALQQIDEPGWLWAEPNGECGSIDECRCTD